MRRIVIFATGALAFFAASAGAAVFTTQPYGGRTFASGGGPFEWGFVASSSPEAEFGGVAYELSSDHVLHRCVQQGAVSLSDLPLGTYSIWISDDYSPAWLAAQEIPASSICGVSSRPAMNVSEDSFTVSGAPPIPENPARPYENPLPPWVLASLAEAGRREQASVEAEQHAKEAAELAEREAREAPLKAVLAREEREAAEAEAAEAKAARVRCVVPALTGRSLAVARHALVKAHCKLGKVSAPHGVRGVVVVGQDPKHGTRLAGGARVAVRVAAPKHT